MHPHQNIDDNTFYQYVEKLIDADTYSYQGNIITIIKVFKDGANSIAIVEDGNGEQFEVFRDQLY